MALGMGCGCGRNKRDLSPGKELSSHGDLGGRVPLPPWKGFSDYCGVWVLGPLASRKLSVHSKLYLQPPEMLIRAHLCLASRKCSYVAHSTRPRWC